MSLKTFNNYSYYDINEILTSREINNLPYTIRILLENMARVKDFGLDTESDIDNVSKCSPKCRPGKTWPPVPPIAIIVLIFLLINILAVSTATAASRQ